MKVGFVV
jgi:nuclear migration protein JNM1